MKRSPFKPAKGKIWKKLEPITKNKAKRDLRFVPESIIKKVKERSGGQCEFKEPVQINGKIEWMRCQREAERTPHHLKKRSQGGKHTLENLRDTCWNHNMFAENFKQRSVEIGWTIL